MSLVHTIDIRGEATSDGCSQLVRGEVRIKSGSPGLDAQIRAIYRQADLRVYALFGGDPAAAAELRRLERGERP